MNVRKTLTSTTVAFSLLGAAQNETNTLFSQWQGSNFGKIAIEKNVKTLSKKEYIALCKSVCSALLQISHQFCGYNEVLDNTSKEVATVYLKEINKVAKIAKKRFSKRKEKYDEKVLYLALSTSHIIKAILDDKFMVSFKGYKTLDNLFEFGKILDKNKTLNHYDTAFWAKIVLIDKQGVKEIKKELDQKGIA